MRLILCFLLCIFWFGCDTMESLSPQPDYETRNVFFEGNIPLHTYVGVSYGAYDATGRSMTYLIQLRSGPLTQGNVAAAVYLPTTIDSLNTICQGSVFESEPDLTFYLEFDENGDLQGDSIFNIPYPSGADVSQPYHQLHMKNVIRTSDTSTVRADSQDGFESEDGRRERHEAREKYQPRQTNNVHIGGRVSKFRSYGTFYKAYDAAGQHFNYGISFLCGSRRCTNREMSIGIWLPSTFDSLSALSTPLPQEEASHDYIWRMMFDADGQPAGSTEFVVAFPSDADADPPYHTLHFDQLELRTTGDTPRVCKNDGLVAR